MEQFRNWLLAFGLLFSASAFGQGMPLPWPFPWAKDCPVTWKAIEGRYNLTNSSNGETIDLRIAVVVAGGYRLVYLARYDESGELLGDGFNFVALDQRVIRMMLYPASGRGHNVMAQIRLHYSDWDLSCEQDKLVPVLSLEDAGQMNEVSYYILERVARN